VSLQEIFRRKLEAQTGERFELDDEPTLELPAPDGFAEGRFAEIESEGNRDAGRGTQQVRSQNAAHIGGYSAVATRKGPEAAKPGPCGDDDGKAGLHQAMAASDSARSSKNLSTLGRPFASWTSRRGPQCGAVVAIANQKGGVGKTTTALSLAAALGARGARTLAIDMDPQGNLTSGLGVDRSCVEGRSSYEVLAGARTIGECAIEAAAEGVWIIGATPDLAGAQVELVNELAREFRLAEAIEVMDTRFDILLIDCPPSLGLLTVNGLVAADSVLVPVQCEYFALEGLSQLLQHIERVRRSLNKTLGIIGLVLTMYDARTRLSAEVAEQVRDHFRDLVFDTIIPRSVRLAEAASYGEPIRLFDGSSRGAIAYEQLCEELVRRLNAVVSATEPAGAHKRSDWARSTE
jgi:chromosome partitioning protein